MSKKAKTIKAIIIFSVAIILTLITLFAGNDVVLVNNGDYDRVIMLSSLVRNSSGELEIALEESEFWHNISNILTKPDDVTEYPSSQLMFVRVAVAINYFINTVTNTPVNTFNIFCLGIMLSIMYAAALTFVLMQIDIKNPYVHWCVMAVALIIMCDIGYVSYFNSLYAEGIQHILLIALIGFLLLVGKRRFNIFQTVLFAFVLILYGQSKFFNIPIAIIIGIIFFVLALRYGTKPAYVILNIGAVLVSVAVMVNTMNSMPKWINRETTYNAVFFGVLNGCSDEQAKDYLKDLKLDEDLYVLKGTHRYVSNVHQIQDTYDLEGAESTSKVRLAMFYAKHPLMTFSKFPCIAQHSGVIRNIFFMDEGYMHGAPRCTLWSKIRENSGFDTIWLNLTIVLGFFILLTLALQKSRMPLYIKIAVPLLGIMAFAYSFIVPYVSNGEADLAKHMYVFIELIDIALIGIIVLSVNAEFKTKASSAVLLAVAIIINLLSVRFCEVVDFGGYEWYVIDENSDCKTLIAKDAVAYRSYHGENYNNYKNSDIHAWLNDSFIGGFSEAERQQLCLVDERVVLSIGDMADATWGNRDFYCSPQPKRVSNNYDTAYAQEVSGYAFLPTAKHISMMAEKGYKTSADYPYWLSTPYFNSPEKSRYVNPDGLVYFDYTAEELGIRPVIYVRKVN